MSIKKTIIITLLLLVSNFSWSQTLYGFVLDELNNGLSHATVKLMTKDSIVVDKGLTDEKGLFQLQCPMTEYLIEVSHVAYYNYKKRGALLSTPLIVSMRERSLEVEEVTIVEEKKVMTLTDNGAMVYDAAKLAKNAPVSNGFDLLCEVPGIINISDNIQLLGAEHLSIVLNGRATHMSKAEIISVLSTISPSQIKNIEIYYSAPPQFGVSGACVNIQLSKIRSERTLLSGDVYTTPYFGRKYYDVSGTHLRMSRKKWSFDVSYALGSVYKHHEIDDYIVHKISDVYHDVHLNINNTNHNFSNRFVSRFSYDLNNGDELSIYYNGLFTNRSINTNTNIISDTSLPNDNESNIDGDDNTQIFIGEYKHKKFVVGGDILLYNYHTNQRLICTETTQNKVAQLMSNNKQNVDKYNLYLNNEIKLGTVSLAYGADGMMSNVYNKYINKWSQSETELMDDRISHQNESLNNISHQKEYSVDGYLNYSQRLNKKMFLTMGLKLEYYRADMYIDDKKQNLWNDVYLVPNITFKYNISEKNTLLFTLSTTKNYPAYLKTSESKRYTSMYISDENNPGLKPYTGYEAQINYVINNKYIVGVYASMNPNMYHSYLHQDSDKLESWTNIMNTEYANKYGIIAEISHNWSKRIISRLNAKIFYAEEKGQQESISYNRSDVGCVVTLKNDFILDRSRTLALRLNATYVNDYFVGLRDLKGYFLMSPSLTWNPAKTGWSVVMNVIDIFNTNKFQSRVLWADQNSSRVEHKDYRQINMTIKYTFNAFKLHKVREVDTTRLGMLSVYL